MKERYCNHCYLVHKEERCPSCRERNQLSTPEDLIFYIEADYFLSPRVEDFLKEEEIPYLKKGELGAGLALKIGYSFEQNLFFIPLAAYKKEKSLLEAFKASL